MMPNRVTVKVDHDVMCLPTIALRGLVVFPNNVVHFEVGRDKSIAAIEWAMTNSSPLFLVTQKEMDTEDPGMDDLYTYGVVAEIKQVLRVSEDLVKVLVEGKYRAKLLNLEQAETYYQASIRPVPVRGLKSPNSPENEALVRSIKELFEQFLTLDPHLSKETVFKLLSSDDAVLLSEYIPAHLLLKYQDKQLVLNESTLTGRLSKILELMHRESRILEIEKEIQERVNEQMEKNQRDYYLREQMQVIAEELDDTEDSRAEAQRYCQKIAQTPLPEEGREKLLKEADRLYRMQGNSQEAAVIRTYLDTCLDLPWGVYTKDNLNIRRAQTVLDKEHYGLEKVKDRILEILAVRKLNPDVHSQIICLVGPPGVGKTSIARSIANCLGRKYVRMSLGGVRDEAEIRGHRRTYIGALPGKIINAVATSKSANPLILLDEIDKMSNDFRGDPAAALLEALDPEQNSGFRDHYLDMPFDLSRVLFITTANDRSAIPGPLLDRMDVIELGSYTRVEKFHIAKRHLLPKQLKENGVEGRVTINNAALYGVIDGYTREAGVRTLERTIAEVLRKCARRIAAEECEKVSVTASSLEGLLGAKRVKPDFISRIHAVGIANGLAWTSVGGEMLPIEVQVMDNGSGKIELTGSLGDVMKESAKLAITYTRVHAAEYGIDPDRLKNVDLHIHAPEGAIPKDGPSAGVTLTTALVSCLSGLPVRSDLAMTGEIALHGNVLPIGGLKEKSMAAYREGMKKVLIPSGNVCDLEEVDDEVKKSVEFLPMENLGQVLHQSLIGLDDQPKHTKKAKRAGSQEVPASAAKEEAHTVLCQ